MEPESNVSNEKAVLKRKLLKEQRKQKNAEKIMCENLIKDGDLACEDKDDQELELEKLVFGGESDLLGHLIADVFGDDEEQITKRHKPEVADDIEGSDGIDNTEKTESKKPAWEDEDDDNILVGDKASTFNKCHKSVEQRSSEKYKEFAREKFLKLVGDPKWAKLKNADADSDSDDESGEKLLQKSGNFLVKSQFLTKGDLDIRKCQNLTDVESQGGLIRSVEFHPFSRVAVAAGFNGTATLYQVDGESNPKIQSVHFEKFPINAAHFSRDGNELLVGSKEFGHMYTYDMIYGKIRKVPSPRGMQQQNVQRFHMSPDGKLIIIQGRYGSIYILGAKTKEWIGTLKMNGEVIGITFNKDGTRMYSHGDFGQVYVWDMENRTCIHRFIDKGCMVGTSCTMSPNDQYLACGSDSGVVNVYDSSTVMSSTNPKPLKAIMNLTTEVNYLKFNHSSEMLAMASNFKINAVKLVHFPSMTVYSNFPTQENILGFINSLDISPNSGYLTMGNSKGKAHLFRLRHFSDY